MKKIDLTTEERLAEIRGIIVRSENREMMLDAEPRPTRDALTQDEMQRIYDLARGSTW
tara:strand:+ start:4241 stop:4414 length:174 start_codon:yes stop_codon:yes gene_type:complete